ncbi:GNAT family N-acetyltransferase [Sphaerisporangium album]|uniref:GNAT family N-acetyltransferase n=1 Tax=Sphaerisporangium album TaxID=509200 RepID=A0A367FA06_9ACTN|nr:GNAT family N-acetyltransferase [Sphaerisporangium album]RCG26515.1 GNAT family N-acetyltransferase [Sphaerisporangium album]
MESVVRVARDGDMPGVREVAAHYELLDDWTGTPDFLDAERAFGTLVVGEVDGRIAGFGGVLRRGPVAHLGDLFVLPEHQSSGIGRAILGRLLPPGTPAVTFASDDPRALALYIRQGMRPMCPLLYLTASPEAVRPPGFVARDGEAFPAPSVRGPVDAPRPETGERPGVREAAILDAPLSGGDRTGALAWYADLPGVTLHVTGTGYAFARVTGGEDLEVGPVGGDTPQDCAAALYAAVAAHPDVDEIQVAVPGVHPVLPRLLESGWQIDDLDTFMATDPGAIRLDRYLPHTDLG